MSIKVTFTGKGGELDESKKASRHLEVGREYEIFSMSVGGFRTHYQLKGLAKFFNSTMFSPETKDVFELWPCEIKGTGAYYIPDETKGNDRMTTIQVKVPDGTDISGYDAEYKIAKSGQLILWRGKFSQAFGNCAETHQIVLTPKWKPPEWLKPGFLFMDLNGKWCWTEDRPNESIMGDYVRQPHAKLIHLSFTNFQGPDVEPKDSLIEIKG